jgi:8-oxo-dGTP pyrophosphatase MutT (NUDIX family)
MSDPTTTPPKPVAAPRDAATVLLLRDGVDADGVKRPEVWLLTRVAQMAFMPGMTVFPGGRVDATDSALPWAGRSAATFAAELDCEVEMAHALVGAAVRETFEEAGVLLTTPSAELAHLQPDVEARRTSFADVLIEHGLAIDGDLIRPWARWITPAIVPTRYDTRFFVAALPANAEAIDLTTESSTAYWASAADALSARDRGEHDLVPPTIAMLKSILSYSTVAEVIAGATGRSLEPVLPVIRVDENGARVLELPDGTVITAGS